MSRLHPCRLLLLALFAVFAGAALGQEANAQTQTPPESATVDLPIPYLVALARLIKAAHSEELAMLDAHKALRRLTRNAAQSDAFIRGVLDVPEHDRFTERLVPVFAEVYGKDAANAIAEYLESPAGEQEIEARKRAIAPDEAEGATPPELTSKDVRARIRFYMTPYGALWARQGGLSAQVARVRDVWLAARFKLWLHDPVAETRLTDPPWTDVPPTDGVEVEDAEHGIAVPHLVAAARLIKAAHCEELALMDTRRAVRRFVTDDAQAEAFTQALFDALEPGELAERLVPIFATAYTTEEANEIAAYLESSAGEKEAAIKMALLRDDAKNTPRRFEGTLDEVVTRNRFYNSHIGIRWKTE